MHNDCDLDLELVAADEKCCVDAAVKNDVILRIFLYNPQLNDVSIGGFIS